MNIVDKLYVDVLSFIIIPDTFGQQTVNSKSIFPASIHYLRFQPNSHLF